MGLCLCVLVTLGVWVDVGRFFLVTESDDGVDGDGDGDGECRSGTLCGIFW